MDLRAPLTADGQPKLELAIMTYSVGMARNIWADADERDVGHLKLYWNHQDPAEVKTAKAAFTAAQKAGIKFFRLVNGADLEGELIETWEQAMGAPVTPGQQPIEPATMARSGGRVQGIPRLAGGAV
jgi:hypothetical protein